MLRRQLMTGFGGIAMALPVLEGLLPRSAQADPASAVPPYMLFYRKPNGIASKGRQFLRNIQQELFWPALDSGTALIASNCPDPNARATGELTAKYWSRTTLLNGLAHPFRDYGHRGGIVQMFTGGFLEPNNPDPKTFYDLFRVDGESLDNRIARELGGKEGSLALALNNRAVNNSGSFLQRKGSDGSRIEQQASADYRDVFDRLFSGAVTDNAAFDRLRAQKKSVNDALRLRLSKLRANKRLSKSDLERLDLHTSNIRDLEKLLCNPNGTDIRSVSDAFQTRKVQVENDKEATYAMRRQGAEISGRIAALAISCGVTRSVLVGTMSDTADSYSYNEEWPAEWSGLGDMHESVSHADLSVPRFAKAHQCADRSHLRMFRTLLDKLDEYKVGGKSLVDSGISLLASDIGQGCHTLSDVPYIYVGDAGGRIKTGMYVDLFRGTEAEARSGSRDDPALRMKHFEPAVKVLNTLGAAVGLKSGSGGPLDDLNADNNGGLKGRIDALVI